MHWFEVRNSCDLSRLATTQSCEAGGRRDDLAQSDGLNRLEETKEAGVGVMDRPIRRLGAAQLGCES